jgi:hypothetical protein
MKINSNEIKGIIITSIVSFIIIVLKLTGYIEWSWWVVLLPLIVPICITVTILMITIIIVRFFRGIR